LEELENSTVQSEDDCGFWKADPREIYSKFLSQT
jgi:hypothetical protein